LRVLKVGIKIRDTSFVIVEAKYRVTSSL